MGETGERRVCEVFIFGVTRETTRRKRLNVQTGTTRPKTSYLYPSLSDVNSLLEEKC